MIKIPDPILIQICTYFVDSPKDLESFGRVCHKLHAIAKDPVIDKLYQAHHRFQVAREKKELAEREARQFQKSADLSLLKCAYQEKMQCFLQADAEFRKRQQEMKDLSKTH